MPEGGGIYSGEGGGAFTPGGGAFTPLQFNPVSA